ncbi:Sterol uptake control protein 2 [Coniochaeta hoffmannii]|uniref:Sterol uptake control protein 2 n=1 Tax=Coniochaeta hoffmannii TaxID=91930 RepID=A0AA38VZC7_9PEZI|nr:Sterol uptake control protein 2 [Coniochaeta hoffmannii]
MSASPRPSAPRTSHTCVTCRARKVRCDGRRGICTNCERLGFACSYDESVAIEVVDSTGTTSISVPRRRVRQACLSCHAKKARCSGQMPKCDRCRVQGLECVYRPGKRSIGTSYADGPVGSSQDNPASPATTPDANRASFDRVNHGQGGPVSPVGSAAADMLCHDESFDALALRAFDKFFRHVHHIPMFSFLHRASLMERYHAGLLDRPLLLALIGITALFTDIGPGAKELGARCIEESAALVMRDFEKPSVLRLQALVIITKHRILSRRFSSAFMLHATASRFAAALRLNHENPAICFLAQESRRRLMWSLYMLDTGISSGQVDFALWPTPENQIHVQLPCNERNFEFDLPEPTEPLKPPDPGPDGLVRTLPDVVGFLALHVRIQWIRSKIQQHTTSILSNTTLDPLTLLSHRTAELAAELDAFEARLPLSFRWSEANLRLRAYSPRLGIFIMTHVWWQQCHCDLYRLWITGTKEALPPNLVGQMTPEFVSHCRRQCYDHARTMADMFAQLLALGNDIPVMDLDLPVCAYQTAKLLYHGFKTSATEMSMTAESVEELARVCLRIVKQSTAGPAAASVLVDMEKLIADGLALETPKPIPSLPVSGSMLPPLMAPTPTPPAMNNVDASSLSQSLTGIRPVSNSHTGGGLHHRRDSSPMPDAPAQESGGGAASVATHVTSGSNAFEGALDGLDFGLDLFGMDGGMPFSVDGAGMMPSGGGYGNAGMMEMQM